MVQTARDVPARTAWFLTVRVAEVGALVLLVGAVLDARSAWQVGSQYIGDQGLAPGAAEVTLMQRITGMALFGGYRGPISLLVVVLVLALLLAVLHRCQPVAHTRVLRWEWLTLWGVSVLLTLAASSVVAIALFGDDPYAPTEPEVVTANVGPGFHEQLVGNLSWPLGALLLLLPLGLWWARLPDMDDLEDAMDELDRAAEQAEPQPDASVPRPPSTEGAPRPGRVRGSVVAGAARPGRDRGSDQDAIRVDEVEQIEPVERLSPRGDRDPDGSSSNGYEGYFRR